MLVSRRQKRITEKWNWLCCQRRELWSVWATLPDTGNKPTKRATTAKPEGIYVVNEQERFRPEAAVSRTGFATVFFVFFHSWYMKAQQLAPKNGRPYNQLAILALYTKRKLDAVYYYMRSLAASNPFLTARESVMQLFDEARKKVRIQKEGTQLSCAFSVCWSHIGGICTALWCFVTLIRLSLRRRNVKRKNRKGIAW